ncbi:MAG: lysostaphin resistance A-like protein [Candidatus Xenobiia bacterium LiM19]
MEIYREDNSEGQEEDPEDSEEDREDLSEDREGSNEELSSSSVFRSILMIQGAVLVIAILWGVFRKIPWWTSLIFDYSIFWGILLGLALAVLNQGAYQIAIKLKAANIEWVISQVFYPLFKNMRIIEMVLISLLSGFCEESLFRGVLQHEWGLLISSVIFGLLHTGDRRLIASGIWAILSSVILGYSYMVSGNLLIPIFAHAVNNICGIVYVRYFYRPLQRASL